MSSLNCQNGNCEYEQLSEIMDCNIGQHIINYMSLHILAKFVVNKELRLLMYLQ